MGSLGKCGTSATSKIKFKCFTTRPINEFEVECVTQLPGAEVNWDVLFDITCPWGMNEDLEVYVT